MRTCSQATNAVDYACLARPVGLAARKSEIEVLPSPAHREVEADTVRVAADSFRRSGLSEAFNRIRSQNGWIVSMARR